MIRIDRRRFILLATAFATAAPRAGLAREPEQTELVIGTGSGRHRFRVEVVSDPESMARGLMFRRQLAADAGMLFDYGEPEREVAMWMRNTYIPLDMLFIRSDGRVHRVAERAVPHSLESIVSGGTVRAVLEVNGGVASRLGIRPGDKIEHRIFGVPS